MKYKVKSFEIIEGEIDIPKEVIPLKVCLMLTKPLMDKDCKMVDGITCLIPVKEVN